MNLMESSTEIIENQGIQLPCGVFDQEEWERINKFENRPHAAELTKEEVKEIMMDVNVKHPYKRTMVPVDSEAFGWAVKLYTGEVIKAKNRKERFMNFECCNLTWIGPKPRQCVHHLNEKLKNQIDIRAPSLQKYNPTFIPVNQVQYILDGGCPRILSQREKLQELEDKDDLQSVITQDWTAGGDSEDEQSDEEGQLG